MSLEEKVKNLNVIKCLEKIRRCVIGKVAIYGLIGTFGFGGSFVSASCEQEQSQSISISADQLGSVRGEAYLEISTGGVIPYSAIKQGKKIRCSYRKTSGTFRCIGRYNNFGLSVKYEYLGDNNKLKDACESSPLCQYEGIDTVDFDGTYSLSNLLIGKYNVNVNPHGEKNIELDRNDSECWSVIDSNNEAVKSDSYADMNLLVDDKNITQSVGYDTNADITIPTRLSPNSCDANCNASTFKCEVVD
ncbi:hypothetical protein HYX14_03705 [Candidatus Woesearchaeota archaeon]|nr:hypothetical protein [Candidatus Woesearchaeota archaeon]